MLLEEPALAELTLCVAHNPKCVSCYSPRSPRPLDMTILITPVSTANHKSLHPACLPRLLSPAVQTPYSAGHSHTPSIRNLVDRVLHPYRTKVNIAVLMATINVSLNVHNPHRPKYFLRINLKGEAGYSSAGEEREMWQFVRRCRPAG